jgi:ubiquinone/menaquinone biosynthesis C-methylase UbiE
MTAHMQRREVGDRSVFTRHLRAGMRLLDVGCGPGAATLEFATMVAPAEAVGVDNDEAMIISARARAGDKGSESNVRFETGDVYDLSFLDGSFDAAWAQLVFMHLTDPLEAMKEVRRVLRPGGVFGLMDPDLGLFMLEPQKDSFPQLLELYLRVQSFNGGDLHTARKYRRLLLEAGFSRAEQTASFQIYGTGESTRQGAAQWHIYFRAQLRTAVEQGWIDDATNERLLQDLLNWGERPDAFAANGTVVAIGFVD